MLYPNLPPSAIVVITVYGRYSSLLGRCLYSDGLDGGSFPNWKSREDVVKLKKYIQIMDLPYPNHNGLIGMWEDMTNSQLSIFWKPLKELQNEIEEDMKLLPEFRKYKIDEL